MTRSLLYLFLIVAANACLGQSKKNMIQCSDTSLDIDTAFFKSDKSGDFSWNTLWQAKEHADSITTAHGNLFSQSELIGLEKCYKLTNLSIAFSKLDSFPWQIFHLKNLCILSLKGYRWHTSNFETPTTVPEGFSSLQHLKILNLDCNNIEKLPNDIGSLSNLEVLSLRNNSLKTLPTSLTKLKQLKHLDLSANGMKEIPECLFLMTHLKILYLSGNSFKTTELSKLKKALRKTIIKTELK